MKRLYAKRHRSGNVTHWVKLQPGERAVILPPGKHVLLIDQDMHYRLGGQVDEVMQGHVITEAEPVVWCNIEQAWVGSGHQMTPPVVTS
jgi:hypothetical protein